MSLFGLEGWILFRIASAPGLCMLFTFTPDESELSLMIRPRGYKTFFMLNSAEHKILFAHNNCNSQINGKLWFRSQKPVIYSARKR